MQKAKQLSGVRNKANKKRQRERDREGGRAGQAVGGRHAADDTVKSAAT